MPRGIIKDKSGQKYGKLLVLKFIGTRSHKAWFLCRCDCGREKEIRGSALGHKTAGSKSCGCHERSNTLPLGVGATRLVIRRLKNNAIKRGLGWHLSEKQAKGIMSNNCLYCGCPPTTSIKPANGKLLHNGDFLHNGIDRVDSSLDYSTDNVVACCKVCNLMKHVLSVAEFRGHISKVYYHFVMEE